MILYLSGAETRKYCIYEAIKRNMRTYLAGSLSCGELKKLWGAFLEQEETEIKDKIKKGVECFLNGDEGELNVMATKNIPNNLSLLESYYYIRKDDKIKQILPYLENFLLDSGAFTFLKDNQGSINWDEYIEGYATFINENDVVNFMELDIYKIVGIPETERLRDKLENITGKKPIPVWHKQLGKDYFINLCKNYPYVALGGIALKEIPTKKYEQVFNWFITTAHKNGAKIHGLGYTSIEGIKKYHFDSVDSTTWLFGNISGKAYIFDNNTGNMIVKDKPKGKKMKPSKTALFNFMQWVDFQQWAKVNL